MAKSKITREQCREALLSCASSKELLKRFPGEYRRIYEHERDLLALAPWQVTHRWTEEEREQERIRKEEERVRKAAEREEKRVEQERRSREWKVYLQECRERKAQHRAEVEQRKAERKAAADANRERRKKEQAERSKVHKAEKAEKVARYLRGEGSLCQNGTLKWTEAKCREFILEHNIQKGKELRDLHRGCWNAVYKRYPWLFKELMPQHVTTGYRNEEKWNEWTLDFCKEVALRYKSAKEFSKSKDAAVFWWIQKRGWKKECHAHFRIKLNGEKKKMSGRGSKTWDGLHYQDIAEIITSYDSREDFERDYPNAYSHALQTKTLREAMDGHFRFVATEQERIRTSMREWQRQDPGYMRTDSDGSQWRAIYACEFEDGCAYVGLTKDLRKRSKEHGYVSNACGESIVAQHKWQTGLQFTFRPLTEFMPEVEAQQAEGEWKRRYEQDGWQILNRAPTGSLGGSGYAGVKSR